MSETDEEADRSRFQFDAAETGIHFALSHAFLPKS